MKRKTLASKLSKVFLKLCTHSPIPHILRVVDVIFPLNIILCATKSIHRLLKVSLLGNVLSLRHSSKCFTHPLSFDMHVLTMTKSPHCCPANSNYKTHSDFRNVKT